jgi:lysyl-tRNA synthetase class 2
MKKLLVAGIPRLFQFAHTFRNGEQSSLHHPEFLMLEWYRAEDTTKRLMQDCEAIVKSAADAAKRNIFETDKCRCDPFAPWDIVSVAEAFDRYARIDLLATTPDPKEPDCALLADKAKAAGFRVSEGDTWDDLFFRILGERIEPELGKLRPAFLTDYPLSQAALARPLPNDGRLAERFELYIGGIELANAFGELTDPLEQRRRLVADMALKQKLYGETWPVDEDFLEALRFGMPPSAGIAFGIERLLMLATGAHRIEDVMWLPVAIPEGP